MSAPDHRETGRRRKETGTWQRGDRLFPRIDQVRVNFVFIREWAHAQHPVLALQRNVNIGRDVICHQCGNSNAEIDVVAVTQLARGTRSHLVAGPSTRHTSSSRRRVVRFSTRRSLLLDRMTRSTKIPGVWLLSGSSSPGGTTSSHSAS